MIDVIDVIVNLLVHVNKRDLHCFLLLYMYIYIARDAMHTTGKNVMTW